MANENDKDPNAIMQASNVQNEDASSSRVANGKKEPIEGSDENQAIEPKTAGEVEALNRKYRYPRSIAFIISNEFCERFNYYGMRTILVLYLSRQLGYSDDAATVIFHIFSMFVYFLCIFGAIVSDSWLGKFKTIFYLSLIYVAGSAMVTLGAIPPLNLPAATFTMIGLGLVALGSGGIKPCVSIFGGDQFKLPEQVKQMTTFFSVFYFTMNSAALISTTVIPMVRADVRCFDGGECYSLAFGIPAALMVLSIVLFLLGRPLYTMKPPAGNMVVLVSKTIWTALATKCKERKTSPREHWLDYADKKYDQQLISDVKSLMRITWLFGPLTVFWALFDQLGSRWVFQATRMDGDMGSWSIRPDQMNLLLPLLIFVFVPLYEVALYPFLKLIGIKRPLQKLTLGGILAGVAFVLSGVLELQLEGTYPLLPQPLSAQLRVFNGEPCAYEFSTNIPNIPGMKFEVPANGYYEWKDVPVEHNSTFEWTFSVSLKPGSSASCKNLPAGAFTMNEKKAYSLFLNTKNPAGPFYWYEDSVEKPKRSDPLARSLANVEPGRTIKWVPNKRGGRVYNEPAYTQNLTKFDWGGYRVFVDDEEVAQPTLKYGGVYTLIIYEAAPGEYVATEIIVTAPNSINILWQIPQYVVMTLGDVMFSVTGLEFSYSQAPHSLKSVFSACWLLAVAFGNVIVVVIAQADLFDSQASEFFLFAGLMFADMLVFMVLAYFYKPNNPVVVSEATHSTNDEAEVGDNCDRKQGCDNKALERDDD